MGRAWLVPDGFQVVKVRSNDYRPRVHVVINGEPQTVTEGLSIAALLTRLQLNQRRIAVEVNGEILAREGYPNRMLADGDEVEIVHFVGGG